MNIRQKLLLKEIEKSKLKIQNHQSIIDGILKSECERLERRLGHHLKNRNLHENGEIYYPKGVSVKHYSVNHITVNVLFVLPDTKVTTKSKKEALNEAIEHFSKYGSIYRRNFKRPIFVTRNWNFDFEEVITTNSLLF